MAKITLHLSILFLLTAAILSGQAAKKAAPVPGSPGSAGGVKWVVPARWTPEPARPMRVATFKIPPATGDSEAGECIISFFGPGQGGSTQANVDRWISQFQAPDGKPVMAAKTQKQAVNGLPVSTLDISGTYTGAGGPMMATKTPKAGFRLLGAVVEGSQAPVFFKITGPSKTVAAAEAEFHTLVKSLKKE
jgi:hypothetical protein